MLDSPYLTLIGRVLLGLMFLVSAFTILRIPLEYSNTSS